MYDEKEMLRICKKYNIDVVKKDGLPLYMGEEMNEDFSFANLMKVPTPMFKESIVTTSESFNFTLPVHREQSDDYNDYARSGLSSLRYKSEKSDDEFAFMISTDNKNKFAA